MFGVILAVLIIVLLLAYFVVHLAANAMAMLWIITGIVAVLWLLSGSGVWPRKA